MEGLALQIGVGVGLLVIEYFVVQKLAASRRDDLPAVVLHAPGAMGTVAQTTTIRRDLVVNKVTNVHRDQGAHDVARERSNDETWLWVGGAVGALVLLAVGMGTYGATVRDVLVGIAIGLVLLGATLLSRWRDTPILVVRCALECWLVAAALGLGGARLLTQVYAGVSWHDLSAAMSGHSFSQRLRIAVELGSQVVGPFAFQALGAIVLSSVAALVVARVTGVFAAIGALSTTAETSRAQAWLVQRCYSTSIAAAAGVVLVAGLGAALAGGWVGSWYVGHTG